MAIYVVKQACDNDIMAPVYVAINELLIFSLLSLHLILLSLMLFPSHIYV